MKISLRLNRRPFGECFSKMGQCYVGSVTPFGWVSTYLRGCYLLRNEPLYATVVAGGVFWDMFTSTINVRSFTFKTVYFLPGFVMG